MTEIDPDTGMAKLPKGYFWRVSGRTSFDGEPVFDLNIIYRKEETTTWTSWFGKQKSHTKITEEVMYEGYVWDRDNKYHPKFATYLTPSRLKDSSIEELESYLELCEKSKKSAEFREQTNALIGDYPPKSINREETK